MINGGGGGGDGMSEITAVLNVAASVTILMFYARFVSSKTPSGIPRLLAILPTVPPLLLLPFSFSSLHLRGISAFFLSWLSLFKLLLLCFSSGPLSPSLPFLSFLPLSSLPLLLRPPLPQPHKHHHILIKALLFSLLLSLYFIHDSFPHPILQSIYCVHLYLCLDLVLSLTAYLAASLFRLDHQPLFNAPYLSTSLQDFWGRRWNLMVTAILRPSVYGPVRARWGKPAGVLATFLVSGLMHELMFYYLGMGMPTGEMSGFFLLHGVCTAAEGWAMRKGFWEKRKLHPAVATAITLGFVIGTSFLLFIPPVIRSGLDRVMVDECVAVMQFLGRGIRLILETLGFPATRFVVVEKPIR